jgi:DNA invertase Pin-like site-specific DNA recombinase
MSGQHVGYVRVSTLKQNEVRQLDGVMQLDRVFTDKASGGNVDRPELQACLAYLRAGDTLHVHSIDRLARSLQDLQTIVTGLVDKGVTVKFHKESLVFASNTSDPMSTLLLQMLGAVAQFERSLITERRLEGIAIAKRNGIKFGRPAKLTVEQELALCDQIRNGASKSGVAKGFGISRPTTYDILRKHGLK